MYAIQGKIQFLLDGRIQMQNNYLVAFFSLCSYGSSYKVLLDKTLKL